MCGPRVCSSSFCWDSRCWCLSSDESDFLVGEKRCASLRKRRSEEHTSELQSHLNLVCRLLLEKKKNTDDRAAHHKMQGPCLFSTLKLAHSGLGPLGVAGPRIGSAHWCCPVVYKPTVQDHRVSL